MMTDESIDQELSKFKLELVNRKDAINTLQHIIGGSIGSGHTQQRNKHSTKQNQKGMVPGTDKGCNALKMNTVCL